MQYPPPYSQYVEIISFASYLKTLKRIPIHADIVYGEHELFNTMKGVFFEEVLTSYSHCIEGVYT